MITRTQVPVLVLNTNSTNKRNSYDFSYMEEVILVPLHVVDALHVYMCISVLQ